MMDDYVHINNVVEYALENDLIELDDFLDYLKKDKDIDIKFLTQDLHTREYIPCPERFATTIVIEIKTK